MDILTLKVFPSADNSYLAIKACTKDLSNKYIISVYSDYQRSEWCCYMDPAVIVQMGRYM